MEFKSLSVAIIAHEMSKRTNVIATFATSAVYLPEANSFKGTLKAA